jgi:hypothetical protein
MASEVTPFLIVKAGEARVVWLARAPIATRFHQLVYDLSNGQNMGGRYPPDQIATCLLNNQAIIEKAVTQLAHNRAAAYLPK